MSALLAAAPAFAASTISFNVGGTGGTTGRTFTDGVVSVHVTAWSLYNGYASAGSLGQYAEGLGVSYGKNDEHTIDNNRLSTDNRYLNRSDFILLSFSKDVTLQNATFMTGWFGFTDTDASISYAKVTHTGNSAYNSSGSAILSAAATQLSQNLYDSASKGASGNSNRYINKAMPVTSNVWLIAAKIGDVDTYKDSFKIKNVSYNLPPPPPGAEVPEPSVWAMLILGMGMVGGAMRRRNRAALALA